MTEPEAERPPRPVGPRLAGVMAAIVAIQAAGWASGLRGSALAEAVERGAARVEWRSAGEVSESDIREAIDDQRATLPFWAALAAVGDFIVEPSAAAVRAVLAASAFAAIAALSGRPIRFDEILSGAVSAQWLWAIGLAVRIGLASTIGRSGAETSAALLLPAGTAPAALLVALRQLDVFALLGWAAVGRSGWRAGSVGWFSAAGVCLGLWAIEGTVRIGVELVCGAAMRASLMPA